MNNRYLTIAGVGAGCENPKKSSTQVILSDFLDLAESGQIAGTVVFDEGTHTIYAHVTAGQRLRTVYSKEATDSLQERLIQKGIRFAIEPAGGGSIWHRLLCN